MLTILPQDQANNTPGITLGYWGIRGLAQPIRFLLTCAEVPFTEVRLGVFEDGSLMSKELEDLEWAKVRARLDMPFPNLPYLIDSSEIPPVQLTQSNAILRYLARRYNFYGESELERTEIDVLQDQAYDFRNAIIKTAYTMGDEYHNVFKQFATDALPRHLDSFEHYLADRDSQKYFVGNRLSLVDFILYELLWQITKMVPSSITASNNSTLFAFIQQFELIPQIAAYMKSNNYINKPINSLWASFA